MSVAHQWLVSENYKFLCELAQSTVWCPTDHIALCLLQFFLAALLFKHLMLSIFTQFAIGSTLFHCILVCLVSWQQCWCFACFWGVRCYLLVCCAPRHMRPEILLLNSYHSIDDSEKAEFHFVAPSCWCKTLLMKDSGSYKEKDVETKGSMAREGSAPSSLSLSWRYNRKASPILRLFTVIRASCKYVTPQTNLHGCGQYSDWPTPAAHGILTPSSQTKCIRNPYQQWTAPAPDFCTSSPSMTHRLFTNFAHSSNNLIYSPRCILCP